VKQSYFGKWYASIGRKSVDREVAQATFNQLQERVMEDTKRERNRYRKALRKIWRLNPADTSEGCNEWGEALCFQLAQDIAYKALEDVVKPAPFPPTE